MIYYSILSWWFVVTKRKNAARNTKGKEKLAEVVLNFKTSLPIQLISV
jgi:hypothetical protein